MQNRKNQKLTSQFPGVSWYKKDERWVARIWIDGKHKYLGVFKEEVDAAQAYRDALKTIGEISVEDL